MELPRLYSNLAKYYDKLESQYRNYNRESAWLASLARKNNSKKIIDISCGTGRHLSGLSRELNHFSEQISEIVAMDASSEMARVAKHSNNRSNEILQADFLNFPFLKHSFDFVLCMYWSLAGLDMQGAQKLLDQVASIVEKKGIFVFDVENAEGIKEHLLGKPFVDAFFVDENESCTVMRINLSTKVEPDLVDWRAFYILDWGTLSRLITDRMSLRFYKRSALESMLQEAGFEVESVSSSPSEGYERNSSSLYFIARRK